MFELEQRGPRETIEERTIWVTYGQDLVNVNSFYIVAESVDIAKVRILLDTRFLTKLFTITTTRQIFYAK